MSKVILVTGCAGNTGRYLCELLLKDENNIVIGIDNLFRGTINNMKNFIDHERFQFIKGDISTAKKYSYRGKEFLAFSMDRNPDKELLFHKLKPRVEEVTWQIASPGEKQLTLAIHNLEEIYNLAAIVPTKYFYERPDLTYKINCEAAIKLFDIAREVGVKRFLNASSSEIYGHNAVNAKETNSQLYDSVDDSTRWSYAHGKILTEYYMNHFKNEIFVVHLRYANCAGRGDLDANHVLPYMIDSIRNNKKLILNSKPDEFKRSYLSMEDAATATYACMYKGISGTAYNVGTREELTISELLDKVCVHLGVDKSNLDIEYSLERPGDPKRRVLNIERIKKDTGWEPEYDTDYIISSILKELDD